MSDNARFLRSRFLERVLEQAPAGLLDVGCGDGALLELCRDAGLSACGVEKSLDRLGRARERGLAVVRGSGHALPWAAASVDWVVLRHVLHHLRDPRRALREAARVARTGIVAAEPWRELGSEPQRTAARIDRWMRRQDRRLGRHHAADLSLAELAEMLAESGAWQLTFETHLRPDLQPLDEVRTEMRARLAGLAEDHPDRAEHDELWSLAQLTGAAWNGTAILVARRPR